MASKRERSPEENHTTSKRFDGQDTDSRSEESQQNRDETIRSPKEEKPDEDERGLNEDEDEEKLRPAQQAVVDAVLDAVKERQPLCVFVDAPAGTGMTHTFKALLAAVRDKGKVARAVAFTGIGATLLHDERTFHSQFEVERLEDNANSTIEEQKWSKDQVNRIQSADVIIWDQAPMAHRRLLEELDRALRDVMKPLGGSEQPFGGKVVVLGGDFRQVLEIIIDGTREETVSGCMLMSRLWHHFKKLKLEENMRVPEGKLLADTTFANWLLKLGEGLLKHNEDGIIQLPEELCMDSLPQAIQWLYHDFKRLERGPDDPDWQDWLMSRAVLATRNLLVDGINSQVTNKFPGEDTELKSTDSCVGFTEMSKEDMNSRCPSGFPPHLLRLKRGMPVMLLKRVNPAKGLCSGIRLTITEPEPRSTDDIIKATIACGPHQGEQVDLKRETFTPPKDCLQWERYQFPVKPAFAMTIYKAQGLTLRKVCVHLSDNAPYRGEMFTHGQLFTAASRVRRADGLRFVWNGKTSHYGETKNIVYQEVLAQLKPTKEEKE